MSDADLALRSSCAGDVRPRGRRWERGLLVATFAYPAMLVGSLHLTWLVAWASLGHRPRPYLDDPKFIGAFVDVAYGVTGALLLVAPSAALLGLVWVPVVLARRASDRPGRALVALAAVAGLALFWTAAVAFLRTDPWAVGDWYMD